MTTMTDIRLLKISDTNEFFQHRLEGLQLDSSAFGGSYEDEIKRGPVRYQEILQKDETNNVIFGAFINGVLIGCVGIYQETSSKARHKAFIWGMYVKANARGQGIGKKLMLAAIAHAKTISQVELINLSSETTNVASRSLYLSLGFKIWGVEPKAIFENGKYYDEDHMILTLS
jgi:RimJ/RimL family protein N-acetyltransferase